MSKLTRHRIYFILCYGIFFSLCDDILFPEGINFWEGIYEFFKGVLFCITWDFLFCKPFELKDKYKNEEKK